MSASWFPKDIRMKEACLLGGEKDSLNIVMTLDPDGFFLAPNLTDQFYPFSNYRKRGRDVECPDPALLPILGPGFLYLMLQ